MFALFVLVFIVFFLLVVLRKRTWINKGDQGEHHVSMILSSLNESEYKILSDVMLQTKSGKTTQIDHIVVSLYGIFVIETKNYSGWIFGHENSEDWTQVIYKEKHKFRNPVKQNQSHIFALKDLLVEYKDVRYFPIVVFVGNAELKDITSRTPVIYGNNLLKLVYSNSTNKCLSDKEIQEITNLILNHNVIDEDIRSKHVENIRQTVIDRKVKMETLICPRCNGQLKVRNGKNGQFYGCSNYPRCRFTMPY